MHRELSWGNRSFDGGEKGGVIIRTQIFFRDTSVLIGIRSRKRQLKSWSSLTPTIYQEPYQEPRISSKMKISSYLLMPTTSRWKCNLKSKEKGNAEKAIYIVYICILSYILTWIFLFVVSQWTLRTYWRGHNSTHATWHLGIMVASWETDYINGPSYHVTCPFYSVGPVI